MNPYSTTSTSDHDVVIRALDSEAESGQAYTLGVVSGMSPPQGYEVVEAIASLLRLDSTLQGGLGGEGRIYEQFSPAEKPNRYIIVRRPVVPGPRPEHFTRVDSLPVQIMAECAESTANPAWWLDAIHNRIYAVLTGQCLALTKSETLLPIKRTGKPSAPAYDADDHDYYSSAEYQTTIGPIKG